METFHDRSRHLAQAAAAAWTEIDSFLAAHPDISPVELQDKLFALESAAEQAAYAYWENNDAEDAKG